MVEPDDKGSEHLLTLRLHTSEGPVTLISAYAPTLTSTPEAKDEFYTNLNDVIKNIHRSEHLVLLGDLNARVGGDHNSWSSCLGSFGVGKINENGYTCNTASESWKYLREAIQKSALAIFGRKTSKNCDWFDAKSAELTPVIEIKRAALSQYKRSLSEKTRSARRKVQHTSRRCANEYWQELSHNVQNAAATGNIRGKYEGILSRQYEGNHPV
ncbi:hypothetical protein SRHO_G00019830 [Serrasalmus rhombeus]